MDHHRADTLAKLTPGLEREVLPLFQEAFMTGYRGAMWFLDGVVVLALAAMLPLMKGMWRKPVVGPATGS